MEIEVDIEDMGIDMGGLEMGDEYNYDDDEIFFDIQQPHKDPDLEFIKEMFDDVQPGALDPFDEDNEVELDEIGILDLDSTAMEIKTENQQYMDNFDLVKMFGTVDYGDIFFNQPHKFRVTNKVNHMLKRLQILPSINVQLIMNRWKCEKTKTSDIINFKENLQKICDGLDHSFDSCEKRFYYLLALHEALFNCNIRNLSFAGKSMGIVGDDESYTFEQTYIATQKNLKATEKIRSRQIKNGVIILQKKWGYDEALAWYSDAIGIRYHYFGVYKLVEISQNADETLYDELQTELDPEEFA